jgi:hypothetical protein
MVDQKIAAVPPLPPKGEMISATGLYMQQISLYRNTLAYGGTRNPTEIYAAMTYNLPQTMAYYRELEAKDEDVSSCLDELRSTVMERDRSVLPAPRDESALAVEVKEFIEEQLGRLDFHAVLDCILDAPAYGFSVQEMVFDTSEGQAELVEISDCPQELFLFGDRFYPQVGPMQLLDNPWASAGTPVRSTARTSTRSSSSSSSRHPCACSLPEPSSTTSRTISGSPTRAASTLTSSAMSRACAAKRMSGCKPSAW